MALQDCAQLSGNDRCADCSRPGPAEYADYLLGVFICRQCAGIHRSLGARISQFKLVVGETWTYEQIARMKQVGNVNAALRYEQFVPAYYRRPTYNDPLVLIEQWIRAKYEREEFMNTTTTANKYEKDKREDFLCKKGRNSNTFKTRLFILDEGENTLRYYNQQKMEQPKGTFRLPDFNVALVPIKSNSPNAAQLTFEQNGQRRNIYLTASSGELLVDWYTSIRAAKLKRAMGLNVGNELSQYLPRDFVKEGWLHKSAPQLRLPFRKRWVTLDGHRLFYFAHPMDADAKGEIVLRRSNGFSVGMGPPPGLPASDHSGYYFSVLTPRRNYHFFVESETEQYDWVTALRSQLT